MILTAQKQTIDHAIQRTEFRIVHEPNFRCTGSNHAVFESATEHRVLDKLKEVRAAA
jgi:hypothetical protein